MSSSATSVPVQERLPREIDGAPVVGALVRGRAVPLSRRVPHDEAVAPVTTRSAAGRDVFRRSAGLALLEAARRVGAPALRIGPSLRTACIVHAAGGSLSGAWIARLEETLVAMIAADEPILDEVVTVDDAIRRFQAVGWSDAAALLDLRREATVEVLRWGETIALKMGDVVPRAGALAGIALAPHGEGALLDFGPTIRRELEARPVPTMVLEQRAPRYGAAMTLGQRGWLEPLGIDSVGALGRACVSELLRELVLVGEGFHEKHLAQVADEVKARGGVRVIAIAGPSSSGKTTFIRRLEVQLKVVGMRPWRLSLDDYFVEREKTVRDASGDYDFEALEALDIGVIADQLARLTAGEEVRPPRFDFVTGRPQPAAGAPIRLAGTDVLLMEGIHALSPRILTALAPEQLFRLYIHPAGSLSYDRLTTLEPADVRLLRRIVRDRHQRGHAVVDTLARWTSVRRGERRWIEPHLPDADRVFDTSLVYEPCVLKVHADRFLLEVPRGHAQRPAADRLRALLEPFVPLSPDEVPRTSILREFIDRG
jgi:uridine kinase